MTTLSKAAVFVNGTRRYRDVKVVIGDDAVTVANTITGDTITSFAIDETVKDGMAWDARIDSSPDLVRLVVQEGCGCSGQKPYQPDPGYSGKL